jgi:hypothetical protein
MSFYSRLLLFVLLFIVHESLGMGPVRNVDFSYRRPSFFCRRDRDCPFLRGHVANCDGIRYRCTYSPCVCIQISSPVLRISPVTGQCVQYPNECFANCHGAFHECALRRRRRRRPFMNRNPSPPRRY